VTSASGRPFVFLDRDGTLVHDTGYVHRVEDYVLLPGAAEGLRRLQAAGFALAIITNQSGIGRGRYATSDFEAFQRHLVRDLARMGVVIERSYHCPHRPDEGCGCRKPEPGLLLRARSEIGAALERSWFVGDAESDVLAAHRAGCAGAVRITLAGADVASSSVPTARNLEEAAEIILGRTRPESAPR
jgi:D-glycero-D-manno-heptose 1,7-bisphosphate phosphatase